MGNRFPAKEVYFYDRAIAHAIPPAYGTISGYRPPSRKQTPTRQKSALAAGMFYPEAFPFACSPLQLRTCKENREWISGRR